MLIYVVLHANPEHLVSNVHYILRFRNQEKLGGEAGYYLSSLVRVPGRSKRKRRLANATARWVPYNLSKTWTAHHSPSLTRSLRRMSRQRYPPSPKSTRRKRTRPLGRCVLLKPIRRWSRRRCFGRLARATREAAHLGALLTRIRRFGLPAPTGLEGRPRRGKGLASVETTRGAMRKPPYLGCYAVYRSR